MGVSKVMPIPGLDIVGKLKCEDFTTPVELVDKRNIQVLMVTTGTVGIHVILPRTGFIA